ncbi:hypothetical protein NEOLEDRAFT_885079 [Neolentinus lepideus HHB14362 ss-1]|uniref:Uncharacterized protein n=1 Tax=Neolentinus lepideus HHB14362 ss-1 TaxID=1314782 RepID=A0A165NW93_9AGAM|nr:hypothetical protein NEOLEDRAFT_885079 [Neolentinus lepideus HHB14362 ss-1]
MTAYPCVLRRGIPESSVDALCCSLCTLFAHLGLPQNSGLTLACLAPHKRDPGSYEPQRFDGDFEWRFVLAIYQIRYTILLYLHNFFLLLVTSDMSVAELLGQWTGRAPSDPVFKRIPGHLVFEAMRDGCSILASEPSDKKSRAIIEGLKSKWLPPKKNFQCRAWSIGKIPGKFVFTCHRTLKDGKTATQKDLTKNSRSDARHEKSKVMAKVFIYADSLGIDRRLQEKKLRDEETVYEILREHQGLAIPLSLGIYECLWRAGEGQPTRSIGVCHLVEYAAPSIPEVDNLSLWEQDATVMHGALKRLYAPTVICRNLCSALSHLRRAMSAGGLGTIRKEDILTYQALTGDPNDSRAVWVKPRTALCPLEQSSGKRCASETVLTIDDFIARYGERMDTTHGQARKETTKVKFSGASPLEKYHILRASSLNRTP